MNKTDNTCRDFEEAFWRLYADKPIERISVRELCELAGYNRGTFYIHYRDIYDLLEMEESKILESMSAQVGKFSPERPSKKELFDLMLGMLAIYERNKRKIVILLGDHGDARFVGELTDLMKQMPIWNTSSPDLDVPPGERDLLLTQTVTGVLALITEWLKDHRGVSATKLLHMIYDTSIKHRDFD